VTEKYYSDSRVETADAEGLSPATILFGLILVTLGGLWLLDVSDVMSVTWTLVGSVMLIIIGALLIAVARQDSHGGMIFLGIVLSAVVLLGSLASWPSWEGGVGDTQISPNSVAELEAEYSWSVGNQQVDLSNLELPDGETEIAVRLGTGNMEIVLPEDADYVINWSVGLGNADIFDESHTGVSRDGSYTSSSFEDAESAIILDVQLGIGNLEVRQ
jgi:hypothetical protein